MSSANPHGAARTRENCATPSDVDMSSEEEEGFGDGGDADVSGRTFPIPRHRLQRRESSVRGPLGVVTRDRADTDDLDLDNEADTDTRASDNDELACSVQALVAQMQTLTDMVQQVSRKQDSPTPR